jgi:hypothetical protein
VSASLDVSASLCECSVDWCHGVCVLVSSSREGGSECVVLWVCCYCVGVTVCVPVSVVVVTVRVWVTVCVTICVTVRVRTTTRVSSLDNSSPFNNLHIVHFLYYVSVCREDAVSSQ